MNELLFFLILLTMLGCALIAGTFFAFSTFVMRALGKLPPPHGLAAMQSINIVVINPVFLGVFMGTALLTLVSLVTTCFHQQKSGLLYVIGGTALYVVGTFMVTMFGNVPLNNALAKLDPQDPEAGSHWASYLTVWTRWNHVRTAAALAATGFFALALS